LPDGGASALSGLQHRQIIAILLHSLHNYTWMIASAALTGIIDATLSGRE
jgi:hypothetical protein